MLYNFTPQQTTRHLLSVPIIYSLIFPLVLADLWVEIYHRTCFSLYGIECVKRSRYIKIDRHKLSKLRMIEKFNCVYCGYANGLIAYIQEIGVRTEKYWCGIKHQQNPDFVSPVHHKKFAERKDFE